MVGGQRPPFRTDVHRRSFEACHCCPNECRDARNESQNYLIDTWRLRNLFSADSAVTDDPNDTLNFPVEFLNEQTPYGMPPHVLLLKNGVIIMLLCNLNPEKGLCNGTRLIIARNFIKAKIIRESNRENLVFIPRIDLAPTDTTLPFILRRRQFPIIPAYA